MKKDSDNSQRLVPRRQTTFCKKRNLEIGRGHQTYAVNEAWQIIIPDNLRMDHDKIYFDFHTPTETVKDFVWEIPGIHNVENATVALAILHTV